MASPTRMKTIEEALLMQQSQPGVFDAFVLSDYCYGDWAWGGLPASLAQRAAAKFIAHYDVSSRHPDVVNMHIQYLRPILRSKKISISVNTTRVTKPMSTVHVAIAQDGKDCVVGYVNLSNLHDAKGPTLVTGWHLLPSSSPADLDELENNTSRDWIRYSTPYSPNGYFRLQSLVHFLLPIRSVIPSMSEEWITPTDPRNAFTNDTLGMVADLWPPFLENYDPTSKVNHDRLIDIARQQKYSPGGLSSLSNELHEKGWTSPFIVTTLSMTLEIKKRLPPSGVKWLFVRAYARAINQGKCDIEVLIMDENRELVALSHQTALATIFSAERRDKFRVKAKAKV